MFPEFNMLIVQMKTQTAVTNKINFDLEAIAHWHL